jgi:hypothetical protein
MKAYWGNVRICPLIGRGNNLIQVIVRDQFAKRGRRWEDNIKMNQGT